MTSQPTTFCTALRGWRDFPGKDPEACLRSRGAKWPRPMGSRLSPIPETRPVGPGTGPTQERVDARERKRKRQERDAARARAKARFATEEQRTI